MLTIENNRLKWIHSPLTLAFVACQVLGVGCKFPCPPLDLSANSRAYSFSPSGRNHFAEGCLGRIKINAELGEKSFLLQFHLQHNLVANGEKWPLNAYFKSKWEFHWIWGRKFGRKFAWRFFHWRALQRVMDYLNRKCRCYLSMTCRFPHDLSPNRIAQMDGC